MNVFASFWQQRNYRIATIVALIALLWLISGVISPDNTGGESERSAGEASAGAESLVVQARRLRAQPYTTRVVVNGHTEANRTVQLRAELDGVISSLPVAEGRAVRQGDVICRIEAEDRPERLEQAKAALRKAELDYAGAQKLRQKGLQSETDIAQRTVALANARADYKRALVAVENLEITAPFDGVVNHRAVELGDFIRRGEQCATLLDLDPVLVVGEVSESQVGKLIPGAPASAQLRQGQRVQGELRYVSQEAHDVTRAYRVEVAVDNSGGELRGGLSGQLALPTGEVDAHRINASLLTLDDRGDLGVRILDEENRVQFRNVTLVGDGDAGVWVTGLPNPVVLITVGQEYVTAGERVQVEMEEGAGDLPPPSQAGDVAEGQPVAEHSGAAAQGEPQ
ncbi:efflux RND transporter periplasmic adaptor subunit [Microbulbifer flavimaris]|uniref:Efflux RND transporter periplasmic adaptor subunit n=1 Tax=Microbulbifer flavimaris TaxID=1781068 RepID=A0ABX4HZ53_9GAMM|nr:MULTISPECIES: efflux RND transporter periplasmic adaptor subunit [Microbulbifer]KUJ82636.1 efflux transporter periplasmic adaptor subunit [Microbulbifer sp. ZGT114]PCO04848.1 efflux RND transporter periplasmic adaptor subunit [Microbulbifer flavimaris]